MKDVTTRQGTLDPTDLFAPRHIGPTEDEQRTMLEAVGHDSLDALSDAIVPESIRLGRELDLPAPRGEHTLLRDLAAIAARNRVCRSYIGMGYNDCVTPPVIQRNILENPGWYTQYTAYQAEISQGRLEALLNFQTMVADLTGLPLANASLLDEGTAAAEAMAMCRAIDRGRRNGFFVASDCHPQTIAVIRTRAKALGIDVQVGSPESLDDAAFESLFGILLSYPATDGAIKEISPTAERAAAAGTRVVVAADLLALTLLQAPGACGADIAVGSTQRFGVPLGYGGPHAAYLATRDEFKRQVPGRIVGVSKDARGRNALRLALQTREQHIRRDKATSNICTAQVLLAIMAGMYGVYHGPDGLRRIAVRIRRLALTLATGLRKLGHRVGDAPFFDTIRVEPGSGDADSWLEQAGARGINLRRLDASTLTIALDEVTSEDDLAELLALFGEGKQPALDLDEIAAGVTPEFSAPLARDTGYMTHEVFSRYHSEHEMLRYLHRLQSKDLSLTQSMIPLGSCTMKLNGTSQLLPLSWPEFGGLHPFAPTDQAEGYAELFRQLEGWLCEITGFSACSLQPNAGAQGEYAGLLVIRAYQEQRGQGARNVCLIPSSAHGTNPASAVMAGMRVVLVRCDEHGNVDLDDLRARAEEHSDALSALMITYPSTHGVFERGVRGVCEIIHEHGGQVYLDGANMNAQVGLCRPFEIGADVCHLNLHKTFCIPHGGGGPGMGPICVAEHLAPFLPGHPLGGDDADHAIGPVAAAPYGSPSILPISWVYIALMGASGLKRASQVAMLNANYMAHRLRPHFPVLYTGTGGLVAHEFILDLRPLKESSGITVDDVAKRLMDYGIHAPTMSWPVAGTLMIEPTESESLREIERFCEAMIRIREEIREIEEGRADRELNLLTGAPHTAETIAADAWDRPYSRERAAFPIPASREHKYWPASARIDNAWGDRNLVCSCPPMESYAESGEEG